MYIICLYMYVYSYIYVTILFMYICQQYLARTSFERVAITSVITFRISPRRRLDILYLQINQREADAYCWQ